MARKTLEQTIHDMADSIREVDKVLQSLEGITGLVSNLDKEQVQLRDMLKSTDNATSEAVRAIGGRVTGLEVVTTRDRKAQLDLDRQVTGNTATILRHRDGTTNANNKVHAMLKALDSRLTAVDSRSINASHAAIREVHALNRRMAELEAKVAKLSKPAVVVPGLGVVRTDAMRLADMDVVLPAAAPDSGLFQQLDTLRRLVYKELDITHEDIEDIIVRMPAAPTPSNASTKYEVPPGPHAQQRQQLQDAIIAHEKNRDCLLQYNGPRHRQVAAALVEARDYLLARPIDMEPIDIVIREVVARLKREYPAGSKLKPLGDIIDQLEGLLF